METLKSIKEYIFSPQIIGPILGVFFTVLLVHWLWPLSQKNKVEAKEKLENFYNVAYAFVKIREGFCINISDAKHPEGELHTKENCGWFHSFVIDGKPMAGLIGGEADFFNFVSFKFYYLDQNLKNKFIEYLKCRGPENAQNMLGCHNSKLIKCRKEIEDLIILQYEKYCRILSK